MAWWDIWGQPLFGAQENDNDGNSTNINGQQNNKSEEAKGRWVLYLFVFLLFRFCFVVGFFLKAFVKFRNVFITKNLVIIYKFNIIENLYY